MAKRLIEGSLNESYTNQQGLIGELNEQTGMNYEVPNALDAITCLFMHHVSSGERLFKLSPEDVDIDNPEEERRGGASLSRNFS